MAMSGAAAAVVVGTTHSPVAGAAACTAAVGTCTHIPGAVGTGSVGAVAASVNMLSSTFRRTVGESPGSVSEGPGSVSASDIDRSAGVATYVVFTSSGDI